MTNIVLIHGTWCDGTVWEEFVNELEKLGLNVYTPTLRYHDLPYEEVEKKVADVSLDEFADDIVDLIETLDEAPIVLGHSLGGLLAQKVAMKTKTKGLILMGTAPAAGIFAFYPSMVICFYKHFLRWGFWKKSMPPYKHAFYDYCMNNQDEADKEREFSKIFDGGCHTPMGCYSQINEDKIKFTAVYSDEGKQIRAIIEDDLAKGKEIAYIAAEEIKNKIAKNTAQ